MKDKEHIHHPSLRAHLDDSTAVAEHILPTDLKRRIAALGGSATSFAVRLQRASLYSEHALATPESEGDDHLFELGRQDIDYILTSNLPRRNKIRLGANVLRAYEPTFRHRAKSSLDIPEEIRHDLQTEVAKITEEFVDGPELQEGEYGQLSELLAILYLLESDLFPYFASWREEANILWKDNHDIYTLHPCKKNRIKKAPASVKYYKRPPYSNAVAVLMVGRLSFAAAKAIYPELENETLANKRKVAQATHLATNIILDKIDGIALSDQSQIFLKKFTKSLRDPLVDFAARTTTPDYASNAETLRIEIFIRELREQRGRKF